MLNRSTVPPFAASFTGIRNQNIILTIGVHAFRGSEGANVAARTKAPAETRAKGIVTLIRAYLRPQARFAATSIRSQDRVFAVILHECLIPAFVGPLYILPQLTHGFLEFWPLDSFHC